MTYGKVAIEVSQQERSAEHVTAPSTPPWSSRSGIGDRTRTHTHIKHERTNTNSAFYPFRGGMTHVVHPRGSRLFGSLAGLRLCMVMHAGSSGGSRGWQGLLGRRLRLGNRLTPVN